MDDRSDDGQDELRETIDGLRRAFADRMLALEDENQQLRQQVERQSLYLADSMARERTHRKAIESQYQLLRAREASARNGARPGPVLQIPVAVAMGTDEGPATGDALPLSGTLQDWQNSGAETGALERPSVHSAAPMSLEGAQDDPSMIYARLPRPVGQSFRPSPGYAAYSLKRGDLRALGLNLIGVSDDRIETMAEEIAQSVALNRNYAPVIFTDTRSELGAFRRRRLSYESLPRFGPTIARLTGIADAQSFYDMRVRYLVRKWQIKGVMNLGSGYTYRAG